jgi:hypothetical protein
MDNEVYRELFLADIQAAIKEYYTLTEREAECVLHSLRIDVYAIDTLLKFKRLSQDKVDLILSKSREAGLV